jgi:hypothetical protein
LSISVDTRQVVKEGGPCRGIETEMTVMAYGKDVERHSKMQSSR